MIVHVIRPNLSTERKMYWMFTNEKFRTSIHRPPTKEELAAMPADATEMMFDYGDKASLKAGKPKTVSREIKPTKPDPEPEEAPRNIKRFRHERSEPNEFPNGGIANNEPAANDPQDDRRAGTFGGLPSVSGLGRIDDKPSEL